MTTDYAAKAAHHGLFGAFKLYVIVTVLVSLIVVVVVFKAFAFPTHTTVRSCDVVAADPHAYAGELCR